MVDSIGTAGAPPAMSGDNTPVFSPSVGAAVGAPQSVPAPSPGAPSGFVAVIPKSSVNVDLQQVNQNVSNAISRLNDMLEQSGRGLSFSMDSSTNSPVITVTSTVTGEVIRQIPNDAVLAVAHNLDAIKGLLYNSIV
jgi:flagellar protein FlaG